MLVRSRESRVDVSQESRVDVRRHPIDANQNFALVMSLAFDILQLPH